jgi:hypothetical protein
MWPGGNYPEQFVARLEQRAVLGSRDMYLFAATLSVMWRKPNRTEGGNELINFVRRTDRYFCEGLIVDLHCCLDMYRPIRLECFKVSLKVSSRKLTDA